MLASAVAAANVLGLVAVGLVCGARTRPMRTGRLTGARGEESQIAGWRTSRTTLLAGTAGVALALGGLAALLPGVHPVAVGAPQRLLAGLAAAGGGFVAFTGLAWRVTSLCTDPEGLTVRFAWRRPARVTWAGCRRLRPPENPISGWRVVGEAVEITLMPSDLFGHEDVLELLTRRAGLRFDGRAWVRGP